MQRRNANYLRRQAEVCIALSRATFDLAVAARLRALAEDFQTKAAEWEEEAGPGEGPITNLVSHASRP